jgi:hypothetical protein
MPISEGRSGRSSRSQQILAYLASTTPTLSSNQSTSHVRYHFRLCLNTSRTTGYEPGVAELLIKLPASPSPPQRFLKSNGKPINGPASKLLSDSLRLTFFKVSEVFPEDSLRKSSCNSSLSHCANPANPANPSHLKLGRLQTVLTPRHSSSCES